MNEMVSIILQSHPLTAILISVELLVGGIPQLS